MPRKAQLNQLSATRVAAETRVAKHHDGAGLYLQVTQQTRADGSTVLAKSWLFRYHRNDRENWMGLGPVYDVSLADARRAARDCREALRQGRDPLAERSRAAAIARMESAWTFSEVAAAYIEANKAGWRNDKHVAQWTSTLGTYAFPVFGKVSVAAIDNALVLAVLKPIWTTKTETATRVRQRIEAVLGYATTLGYREGPNPAAWKGNLENILPPARKVRAVRHHPALAFADAAGFVSKLKKQPGVAARALEFLILTASRTNEVIGARWSEINLKTALWTVPGERMKAGREHTVPLPPRAVALLKKLTGQDAVWVFPGDVAGKPLSNMAMLELLARMKRDDITVHGFRSTFSDWAHEVSGHANHVVEMSLAHTIKNKAEAAYRRGELLDKRRALMVDWSKHLGNARG